MSAPLATKPKRFLPAAAALTLAGLLASTTFARVVYNTIDPIATVARDGRSLVVTGPIRCDANQRASIGVTVTQRSTGALAEGETMLLCTGETQHWEVRAFSRGNEAFREGPATAVGRARTSNGAVSDDAHQWLVEVTLVSN